MKRHLLLGLLPVVLAAATGCAARAYGYVRADQYVDAPQAEFGYEPLLYQGYPVYYTVDSVPFYWVNNVVVVVPVVEREVYVRNYHEHHAAYLVWESHRGGQYRGQRYLRRDGSHDGGSDARDARQPPPRERRHPAPARGEPEHRLPQRQPEHQPQRSEPPHKAPPPAKERERERPPRDMIESREQPPRAEKDNRHEQQEREEEERKRKQKAPKRPRGPAPPDPRGPTGPMPAWPV